MTLPFKGDFRQTQGFGGNKAAYQKYGLQGHNGLDHAVPCGTPLYAMITGIVREVADEGNIGYGKYIKIENDKEGSLVAHLSSFNVKVGDQVKEGETLIGKSGTSGNSTGCHTHTGYYQFPRNRQNGYAGYIDPTPYLNKGGDSDMGDREYRNLYWSYLREVFELMGITLKGDDPKESVAQAKKWIAEHHVHREKRNEHYNDWQTALKDLEKCEKRPTGTTNPKAEALLKAVRDAVN